MESKVDVQDVKARLDPFSVVSQYAHCEPRVGQNIHCPNQRHHQTGETPPCSMDYQTGLWKCWGGSCDAKGDLLDFIGYAMFADYDHHNRGARFRELIDLLSTSGIQPMPAIERQRRLATAKPVMKPAVALDIHMLQDWTDNLLADTLLLQYLRRRGVDSTVVPYHVGYTGKDERLAPLYHDMLIMPYFYRGLITGFKGRSNPLKENKRFRALGQMPAPFNADSLNTTSTGDCWIVESELDALALAELYPQDAVIARPAGSFTAADADLLCWSDTIRVVMDNDTAGGKSAYSIQNLLPRALVVAPPVGYKDLGDYIQKRTAPGELPYWLEK